ncbi:MAG: hypothetical protein EB072_12210 [Betaproteobacteria bacterium]|nr:hypothetical protein [Betaproteobacteria bacterium]
MDAKDMFQKELFELIDRKLTRSEILDALLTRSHFDQRTLAGILHDILLDAKRRDEDAKRREEDSELDFIDEWIDSQRNLKEKAVGVDQAIVMATLRDFELAVRLGNLPNRSALATIARVTKTGLASILYAYAEVIAFKSTGQWADKNFMLVCLEDAAQKGSRQALFWLANTAIPRNCEDLFYAKAMYSAFVRFRGVDQWPNEIIVTLEKLLPTSEAYAANCITHQFAKGWEAALERVLSAKTAQLEASKGRTEIAEHHSLISLLIEIPSPRSFDRNFYTEGSEATYPTLSSGTHSYLANVRTQCKFLARNLGTKSNELTDIQGDALSIQAKVPTKPAVAQLFQKVIHQDTLVDILSDLSDEEAWPLFETGRPCKQRYFLLFRPLMSYLFYLRCIQWIRGEETYGSQLDLQPTFMFDFHDFESNKIVEQRLDVEAFLSRSLDFYQNPLQEDFSKVFEYIRSSINAYPTSILEFESIRDLAGLDSPCYSQNMSVPIECSFACRKLAH